MLPMKRRSLRAGGVALLMGLAAGTAAERLSFSLPLQAEPFGTDAAYNYFANLLPPAVVRKKLEKHLHIP